MKKGDSSWGRKCRLLTLLLIGLVIVGSAANQVNGASIRVPLLGVNPNKLYETVLNNSRIGDNKDQLGVSTNIRQHLLYNLCSDKFVQLLSKGRRGVKARGRKGANMHFSKLWFESTSRNTIIIRAAHKDLHMCFNRRGKLIARHKHKQRYCEFTELYSPDQQYTQYVLASRKHTWFVGFDQRGKSLRGISRSSENENCFNFLKFDDDLMKVKKDCISGNGPSGVNFCDKTLLETIIPKEDKRTFQVKRHKLRHQKHRRRRRKG